MVKKVFSFPIILCSLLLVVSIFILFMSTFFKIILLVSSKMTADTAFGILVSMVIAVAWWIRDHQP